MLKAGAAKVDITPPVGVRLSGYAGRVFPSLAVHDPLWARALVLEDSERRVGLVACDLIGLSAETVAAVRARAAKAGSLPGEALLVAGTHTHSGPAAPHREPNRQEQAYWGSLPARLAEAVAAAAQGLAPARLGVESGWSAVGINRREMVPGGRIELGRNHFGPFDPEVGLIRVEREDGAPLAGVLNYACHGICLQFDNYLLTADYPGFALHWFEREVGGGVMGLFLNGACGDVNPREAGVGHGLAGTGGFRVAERAGRHLAGQAAKAWRAAEVSGDVRLSVATKQVALPTNRARALAAAEEELQRVESAGGSGEEWSPYLTWYDPPDPEGLRKHIAELREQGEAPVSAEVQALGLGPAALVGWPGEVFSELGMMVKRRSLFRPTYVAGYANGSIGYVPTPEAFALGGYEVACAAHLADEAGLVLVEETLGLLSGLAHG